jgi:hypothetical protein
MVNVTVSRSNSLTVVNTNKNNSVVLVNNSSVKNKVEIEDNPEEIKNIKVAGQAKINITSAVNPLQQEPDLDGGSF